MSFKCLFCSAAVSFAVFGSSELRAQGQLGWPEWLEVADTIGGWTALYFINPLRGVTAVSGGSIYYTVPGRWVPATVPAGLSFIRAIRSIQGKLYAASAGTDVLVSTDSGHTWNFSGLSLNNANDVYADSSGTIRILTDPMVTFARIDTAHCVAVGNGNVYISSDGGSNWQTAPFSIDPASGGIFADPCYHVFLCSDINGTSILRSTDSGQTWQSAKTGMYDFPQSIYGASTVAYSTDTAMMFRSIDDGVTWSNIVTVNAGRHLMYAWGPMGEHVAITWTEAPGIFMTTTGGDDNLHSAVAMTDSNGAPLEQEDTMNVPFRVVSECNSFLIPIALEADVPGISVKATLTDASGGDYSLGTDSMSFPDVILNGHYDTDTMWLSYTPHHLVDTALITFQNQWNCSEWTETRTVIVTALPSALILPPPVLTGNCQPVTEAAIVQLDSCQELIIDSIHIPADLESRFTTVLPDTLRAGKDSILFTFNPADTVATISDSIQIFGHFSPSGALDSTLNYFNFNVPSTGMDSDYSFFEQTIPIELIALPSGIALYTSDSVISLARASYCQQELDTSITFKNNGCAPDTITQATLSGTGYSMTGNTVPIIIPEDSSASFAIYFIAPDTGTYSGTLQIQATSGNTAVHTVHLSGAGYPHVVALGLSVSSDSISLARASYCQQELDTSITFKNNGCAPDTITQATLSGTGYSMTGNTVPIIIPEDSSASFAVYFIAPDTGTYSGTLQIQATSGNTAFQTLYFSGVGYPHIGALATNPLLAFDTGYVCQDLDSFIVLSDTGCDWVNVTGISQSGTGFSLSWSGSLSIAPGETDTIAVRSVPDTSNGATADNGTVTIESNSSPPLAPIVLTREIVYPVAWALSLSPPNSATVGSDVVFQVIQTGTLPADVDSLDFTITYNDDLLQFDSADGVDTIGYYRSSDGFAHTTFEWNPVGNGSVVATLHFHSYVAATLQTTIGIDSVTFHSTLDRSAACVASLSAAQTTFTLIPGCGTSILSGFLRTGTIAIDNIDPNPASDAIEITISLPIQTSGELTILDAIGRVVSIQDVELTGHDAILVAIENLPSGMYAVQLRAAGFTSTRDFVKE